MENRRAQALVVLAVVAGALLMVAAGLSLIADERHERGTTGAPAATVQAP